MPPCDKSSFCTYVNTALTIKQIRQDDIFILFYTYLYVYYASIFLNTRIIRVRTSSKNRLLGNAEKPCTAFIVFFLF